MITYPIYPIKDLDTKLYGSGTMIGDFFVTAGHVIGNAISVPFIEVEGKRILLDKTRLIFYNDGSKHDSLDLAIYRIPELKSDIILSDEMPETGTIIKSISYRLNSGILEKVECDVTVSDIREGYYFGSTTSINLKAGSSGSPVLSDKKVLGIMCRGNIDKEDENGNYIPCNTNLPLNFCVFLSSKAILDKING